MFCNKYGANCRYKRNHCCIAKDYVCKYQEETEFEKIENKKEKEKLRVKEIRERRKK